jgi:ankyrin repeat protein
MTPLHYAVDHSYEEVIEYLIGIAGIDPNLADSVFLIFFMFLFVFWSFSMFHWTILHSLARNVDHPELVPIVFRCPTLNVNFAALQGWTPLHFAALAGNLVFIKHLDFETCDVNAIDDDDVTPLHLAARSGHTQVIEFLLGIPGIDITFRNKNGDSPLHEAICANAESVELLITQPGIDLNVAQTAGLTPLHCAVIKQQPEIVRLLVGREQVNMNCVDAQGRTPLHFAAELHGMVDMVKCLALHPRTDINRRDRRSVRPSQIGLHFSSLQKQIMTKS